MVHDLIVSEKDKTESTLSQAKKHPVDVIDKAIQLRVTEYDTEILKVLADLQSRKSQQIEGQLKPLI